MFLQILVICIVGAEAPYNRKSFSFAIRWMPSHLQPYAVRPPGVSHLDVIGNNFADAEAFKAAKTYCVELNASSQFFHRKSPAGKTWRCVAAIIQDLLDRKGGEGQRAQRLHGTFRTKLRIAFSLF